MVRGFDKRQTSFASLQWDETLYGEICIFMKSQMHEIIATGVRPKDFARYVSRVVKYNKKSFDHLTTFFMST